MLDYVATEGQFARAATDVRDAHKWNVAPVAMGAGCMNACTAHLDPTVTNMITGHYSTIVSSYASYYASGRRIPLARKKAAITSFGCLLSFSSGAFISAAMSSCASNDWQL